MDLSARDVHEKQFHDAWRGYNQEEVDDFLDSVAETIDRVGRENQSLQRRVQELDRAISHSRNTEEMLKKTLLSAQKAANEAIAAAKAKAEQLINDAELGARRTGEAADRRAAEIDRDLAARRRELETSIQRLRAREQELKQRLQTFLEQQVSALATLDPPAASTQPVQGRGATGAVGGPRQDAAPQRPEAESAGEGGRETAETPSPGRRPVQEGVAGVRSLFRREENR